MAMCTSGNLSIKATAGLCRSICTAVVQAGGTGTGGLRSLTTQTFPPQLNDGSMTQFYGYNPVSYSISVSLPSTNNSSGQIAINTLSASGAWSASKSDPDNIVQSYTGSGSGGQKITAGLTSLTAFFDRTAIITYCLTAAPTCRATWTITIDAFN